MRDIMVRQPMAGSATPACWTGLIWHAHRNSDATRTAIERKMVGCIRSPLQPMFLEFVQDERPCVKNSVRILADQRWNDTLIDIHEGQRITITAQGSWKDSTIICGPDGFERPWLNWVRWSRRAPRAPWFCLIASVGQMKRPLFPVGRHVSFEAPCEGRLYLFANDAWAFYFNNSGCISAVIEVADS